MTDAAADTLLSNSTASLGSIGSTQRSEMPALNPASARSRIASRLREASLGRKPLDSPAASASRIKQAVVQPVGAALPELDALRNHAVAAPVRGPKGALAVAPTGFLHGSLQRGAVRHALALRRGPGREPGAQRPGRKVRVRLLGAQLLDAALDADLPLQVRPQDHQARGGARVQLAALAAAVVGVEDEAAALDAFQEHRPGGGRARFRYSSKRCRVGQRQARAQRVLEPMLELAQRIAVGVYLGEARPHVLLSQLGDVHRVILPRHLAHLGASERG